MGKQESDYLGDDPKGILIYRDFYFQKVSYVNMFGYLLRNKFIACRYDFSGISAIQVPTLCLHEKNNDFLESLEQKVNC